MSLQQTTWVVGKFLLPRSSGTCIRANLCSRAGGRLWWNGVLHYRPSRRFFKFSSTSTTSSQSCQWYNDIVKLLFGKKMSARESLETILELLRKQFNVYTAQRLRRMSQTINLYGTLYAERSLSIRSLATNFAKRYLKGKRRPFYVVFGGACCAWDKDKITESEFHNRCSDDINLIAELERLPNFVNVSPRRLSSWEVVINKEDLRVWKRPIHNNYLYEFKVCGRFKDISAKAFFHVQLDLEYRKVWDKYVMQLDCVDRDEETGAEVVHWVTHFPSRDYVFTRRYHVDQKNKTMMLVSRAINHPMLPPTKKHVRVTTYFSQMVIKPHHSFEENGLDYVLTYHDDPQAMFPQFAVNWVTHKGCPDYVSKLHSAAKQLNDSTTGQVSVAFQDSSKVKPVKLKSDDQKHYTGSSAGHYA